MLGFSLFKLDKVEQNQISNVDTQLSLSSVHVRKVIQCLETLHSIAIPAVQLLAWLPQFWLEAGMALELAPVLSTPVSTVWTCVVSRHAGVFSYLV